MRHVIFQYVSGSQPILGPLVRRNTAKTAQKPALFRRVKRILKGAGYIQDMSFHDHRFRPETGKDLEEIPSEEMPHKMMPLTSSRGEPVDQRDALAAKNREMMNEDAAARETMAQWAEVQREWEERRSNPQPQELSELETRFAHLPGLDGEGRVIPAGQPKLRDYMVARLEAEQQQREWPETRARMAIDAAREPARSARESEALMEFLQSKHFHGTRLATNASVPDNRVESVSRQQRIQSTVTPDKPR